MVRAKDSLLSLAGWTRRVCARRLCLKFGQPVIFLSVEDGGSAGCNNMGSRRPYKHQDVTF